MAEAASDLRLFFSTHPDDPRWVEAELGEEFEEVKAVATKHPGVAWSNVSKEIGEKVEGLLNVDIVDVLCSAWNQYRFLQQFRDKNKYGPDETILVPLARHSVRSVHRPIMEFMLNDVTLGRLEFEIDLRLDLEGVLLKVRDGKIWEIKSGHCSGKGVCKCGDVTLMTKETPKFDLPGRVKLEKAVEIPAISLSQH
jgi:hypothetical protein